MENEFDSVVDEVFTKQSPQASEYDESANEVFGPKEQIFKQAQIAAKDRTPESETEALSLSKEYNVPVDFVNKNIEEFRKSKAAKENSYEDVVEKSPRLATFLGNPTNMALAKDDIDTLSRVEGVKGGIRPYEEKGNYFGDLGRAGRTGVDNLAVSAIHLGLAFEMGNIDDYAETIAATNKKVQERQSQLPVYAQEFQKAAEEEMGDIDKAFERFKGSFDKIQNDQILNGLKDFGVGGATTVGETIDMLYELAVKRPKGTIRATTESLAFSIPSLVTGIAGAKGGAVAGGAGGAAIGSIIPGAGTAAGGAVGGTVGGIGGFAAGTFAGSTATEFGAWVNQSLSERGFDITDAEALKSAYKNKKLMAEIRGEATRKGIGTASVDALFSVFGAKYLSKFGKGASTLSKVKKVATNVGVQTVGEGVSEFAGQVAARKGDLSKVSVGEAAFEAVVSLGNSMAEQPGQFIASRMKSSFRKDLPSDTVEAAKEVAEKTKIAQDSLTELQALEELGKIATESKLQDRSKEKFAEIIQSEEFGDAPQEVYFQKEDWDNYWTDQGESPIAKAEELLSLESYNESAETGQQVQIDIGKYVAEMAGTEHFDGLMSIVKTKPDGLNADQAIQHIADLPATVQELAKEAETYESRVKQAEESAKIIKKDLQRQLKEAGRNPIEAEPIVAFYTTLGIKEGIDPAALFKRYGLEIKQSTDESQSIDGTDGTVFEQNKKIDFDKAVTDTVIGVNDGQENGSGSESNESQIPESEKSFSSENQERLLGLPKNQLGGDSTVRKAAKVFSEKIGLSLPELKEYQKVDTERAARIADAFEEMEHNPSDPEVQEAYQAMIEETVAQYNVLVSLGYKFEFMTDEMLENGENPYPTSNAFIKDMIENKHLYVFPTDDGFGSSDLDVSDNPLLGDSGIIWNGKRVTFNDVFRAVHDAFGHAAHGNGFRANGEETAWAVHARMYSPKARRAMTTETRGQNSWLNYGPHGETNRTAGIEDTVFADQKIGLLPEWVSQEGLEEVETQDQRVERAKAQGFDAENVLNQATFNDEDGSIEIKTEKVDAQMDVQSFDDGQFFEDFFNYGFSEEDPSRIDVDSLLEDSDQIAILNHIEVTKQNRGEGLGSQALKDLEKEASKNGVDTIVLNASPIGTMNKAEKLDKLISFYKKNGYKLVRKSKENAEMIKKIDPSFNQDKRGRIKFKSNKKFTIELFEKADKSTFFHETGHYFLEVLKDMSSMPTASEALKEDFQSILEFLGVESVDQIGVEQHELWARGFEAYLREGNAPSSKLRKAFNTFKVWLINVYNSVAQLDVTLNPEIRDVMDRMLATEEEIRVARESIGDEPLFVDPIESGMTKAQAEKYKEADAKAKLYAEEQLMAKNFDEISRQETRWWKKELKAIEGEVELEVNEMIIYKVLSHIRRNELPNGDPLPAGTPTIKLSKQVLLEQYDQDFLSKLPKPFVYTTKDGVHPEIVAGMYGFEDADALITAIANAPNKKDLIKETAEKIMKEKHGDMMSDEEMQDLALEYVHNEDRSKKLRLEYEHLSTNQKGLTKEIVRRVTRRPAPDMQMKEQAQKIIAGKKVGSIRPNAFRLAERKYAKEAGKQLANGDIEAAFLAKQNELINHYLYKFAQEAVAKVKKDQKLVKKFFDKDDKLAKSRDTNIISAGRAILSRYGLGNSEKSPLEQIAAIKEYAPEAYENISGLIAGVIENPDNFKVISFEQYTDLMDTIKTLWDLSKEAKQIEINGQKIEIEKASQELITQMDKTASKKTKEEYARTASDFDKFKRGLLGLKAMMTRFESWVDFVDLGDVDGPFRKYLYNPVSEATTEFLLKKTEFKERFVKMSEEVKEGMDLKKEIVSDELAFTFKNKSEILGALLHTGNKSNMKKLLVGREWGMIDEDGNLVTKKWDDFINRMIEEGVLTKADFDYIQGVWDLMEEAKPLAQKAHKKIFGYFFNEISSDGFENKFGKYRGGYAPAVVDPFAVQDLTRRQELEAFMKGHPNFMLPHSGGRGFTKGRVENYNKPLNIDISLVSKHIEDVLRFSIVKPAVVDSFKTLTHKEFEEALGEYDSEISAIMIKPALNRADKNQVYKTDPSSSPLVTRFTGTLRNSASLQLMFANIVNTAEQIAGFGIAATRISPLKLAKAGTVYLTNPKAMAQQVNEASDFMKTRTSEQIFEMDRVSQDIFADDGVYKKTKDLAQKHAYFAQIFTQNIVEYVVWSGSYDESVAKGLSHESAVRKADADVRITQSSRRPVDVSHMETNRALNFFQMFMNFFNMMINVNVGNFQKLYHEDLGLPKKAAKGFYLYMMGFASVAVISGALRKGAAGGLDEDEDGDYADDLYDVFIGSQIDLATAMLPVVGPAINAGLNQANDKFYDDRVSASPAISAISTVVGTVSKAATGKLTDDKNVNGDTRDALTALGILTGLPFRAASKPITYYNDVKSGKARPKGPVDAARGVITGKPGIN